MTQWKRWITVTACFVCGGAVLWILLDLVPEWIGGSRLRQLDPRDQLTAVSTIRGQIGTVLSALSVAAGLYFTGRKFVLERDKQYTDRYSTAIDHLGSDNQIVRAGGVRALDRILRDSDVDRNRVLDSITDFLRQRTQNTTQASPDRPLPTDIAAAIATLRHPRKPSTRAPEIPLDLHDVHIPAANLHRIDLSHARLRGADLTNADLSHATLTATTADHATLINADLTDSDLTRATLTHARLTGANLTSTRLDDADLTAADLSGSTLTRATFTNTTLVNTNLRGTDLSGTTGLTNAQIKRAQVDNTTHLPADLEHPHDGPTSRPGTI
jgi:uncharacterized protein YjbI with pentapeptide repeats